MIHVFIPLCGRGSRFAPLNKPFVNVFEKPILNYVTDVLSVKPYIIVNDRTYNSNLEKYGTIVNIHKETVGAAETILEGVKSSNIQEGSILIIDCDNYYTVDLVKLCGKYPNDNQVFSFYDEQPVPYYSYVSVDASMNILQIREKEKISNYANTGAYYFANIPNLVHYCEKVLNEKQFFKGEAYISSVIHSMLQSNISWKCNCISKNEYHSLGTPEQVAVYKQRTYAFLFDLDGTLVNTDEAYYSVWEQILTKYNIFLNNEIYDKYIYSNSDIYVKQVLLKNAPITAQELSAEKDRLFQTYIDKVRLIHDADTFLQHIQNNGHKIAIVTNSNRQTAELIIQHLGLNHDMLVIGNECSRPKPYADPYIFAKEYFGIDNHKCIVFEDSHNGLLSAKGVQPHCMIGIGTDETSLIQNGANIVISDYSGLDIQRLIDFKEDKKQHYERYIFQSLQKAYPEIVSVKINPISLKGGFIADVFHVVFNDGQLHEAIFKVENTNESDLNKIAHELELYNRENYFYESISAHIPVHTPYFYGLIRDDDYKIIGMLLGNLNRDGFHLNLDLNKEPIETTLAVICDMAKLHASTWGKKLPQVFTELKKNNDPAFYPKWGHFIQKRIDLFIEKWGKILPEGYSDLYKKIAADYLTIQNELSEEPLSLVHGDVKSPNIFYKKTIEGRIEPYFIDWQYIVYGKGVQDLVFFMIESFTKSNIDKYYTLFKEYYYAKLVEFGVKDYSREVFEKDFRNAAFYFPFFVAIWFGTTPTEDLIDVNFPYFFIDRLTHFYQKIGL